MMNGATATTDLVLITAQGIEIGQLVSEIIC